MTPSERVELARWRTEVTTLRMERELLKKAEVDSIGQRNALAQGSYFDVLTDKIRVKVCRRRSPMRKWLRRERGRCPAGGGGCLAW